MNFQLFKLDLEKAEEPGIKLPTSAGSSKKQESSRKISTFYFIDYAKAFHCVVPGSSPGGSRVIRRGDGVGVLEKNVVNYRYIERLNRQHLLDHRKSKKIPEKTYTSASLTTLKPLNLWITTNSGKF